MLLEEVSETLTYEGYECFVASNVKAAVEIVETTPGITLIITDLKMQGETGADLIKIVEKKSGGNIKFIIISGHAILGIEENGIDLSLYPFLSKPLGIENLTEKIASVLGTKE